MKNKNYFFSGYFNLLKSIIGGGILAYPTLFYLYGTIPTFILLFISASFSIFGLFIYIKLNHSLGDKKTTMSGLAKYTIPSMKHFVDVIVVMKCFGVGLSYLTIIKIIFPKILRKIGLIKFAEYSNTCLIAFVVLTSPLSYLKKLDSLRFSSFVGISGAILMISISFYRYLTTSTTYELENITSNHNYIKSIGSFVFSFTCHQNIFLIQNELNRSLKFLYKIIITGFLTVVLIYITFGILNLKIFGPLLEKNVFEILPDDNLTLFFMISYLFMLSVSFPVQANPCRLYFLNMFNEDYCKLDKHWRIRWTFTTFLLVISTLITLAGIKFETLLMIVGGTSSTFMCFIVSGIFYLSFRKAKKTKTMSFIAILSITFGFFVFGCLIYTIIQSLNK